MQEKQAKDRSKVRVANIFLQKQDVVRTGTSRTRERLTEVERKLAWVANNYYFFTETGRGTNGCEQNTREVDRG